MSAEAVQTRNQRELIRLKVLLADERGNTPLAGADLALVQRRSTEAMHRGDDHGRLTWREEFICERER